MYYIYDVFAVTDNYEDHWKTTTYSRPLSEAEKSKLAFDYKQDIMKKYNVKIKYSGCNLIKKG